MVLQARLSVLSGRLSGLSLVAITVHPRCQNSTAIQKASDIDGFVLPNGRRAKVFQYADDFTVLVRSDSALHALFSLFSNMRTLLVLS